MISSIGGNKLWTSMSWLTLWSALLTGAESFNKIGHYAYWQAVCGALFRCRVTSKSTFNLNPEHLSPTKFWKGRVGRRTIAKPASLGGRFSTRLWHTCCLVSTRWLVMPCMTSEHSNFDRQHSKQSESLHLSESIVCLSWMQLDLSLASQLGTHEMHRGLLTCLEFELKVHHCTLWMCWTVLVRSQFLHNLLSLSLTSQRRTWSSRECSMLAASYQIMTLCLCFYRRPSFASDFFWNAPTSILKWRRPLFLQRQKITKIHCKGYTTLIQLSKVTLTRYTTATISIKFLTTPTSGTVYHCL